MTTAAQVIQDALAEIIVAGSESPIEAADSALAIRKMNEFMSGLELDCVDLGWTTITSVGDDITLHAGLIGALVANLAVLMAPTYGATVPPELHARARDGYSLMLRHGMTICPTRPPCGLPVGAGNEGAYGSPFFPGSFDSGMFSTDRTGYAQVIDSDGNVVFVPVQVQYP